MNEYRKTKIKDTASLAEWIRVLLIAEIIIAVVAIGSEIYALSLADMLREGSESTFRIADEIDGRQAKIGWTRTGIFVFTAILFLIWTHGMNANARALGAEGMRFTPGWAVGWYFIPIANLWKPYQAMKEIWRAHANPRAWQDEERPPLLPLWWGLWIVAVSLDRGTAGLIRRIETVDDWQRATQFGIANDIVRVALDVVVILMVLRLVALQKATMERLRATSPP